MKKAAVMFSLIFVVGLLVVGKPYAPQGTAEAMSLSGVVHENHQGFDTCSAPSLDKMRQWWVYTPYYYVGIYIGGVNRGCSQPNLSSYWVSRSSQEGWKFVPTWVGPQAPCSLFYHKFSWNTSTAYQQGVAEARSAAQAARNLGLSDSIIYYDMERYNDNDSACREAVKAFLRGWVQQLHNENFFWAGVYASPCNANDYYYSYPRLDAVWGASWVYSRYSSSASPYGMACLPDSYWQHQRLRQYAGGRQGHKEKWGSVEMKIDSDVADGPVATSMDRQKSLANSMGLVSDMGWLVTSDGQLWITQDRGQTWKNITPPHDFEGKVAEARFLNSYLGWAVLENTKELNVYKFDKGAWLRIAKIEKDWRLGPYNEVSLFVLGDKQHIWMNVKEPTSVNFNLGELFISSDGGVNWEKIPQIPSGGRVYFTDAFTGWIVGGAAGKYLFHTSDGGRTWKRVSFGNSLPDMREFALPVFINSSEGWLILHAGNEDLLFSSSDGGKHWNFLHKVSLQQVDFTFSPQAAGAVTNLTTLRVPEDTLFVTMATKDVGWAYAEKGKCEGKHSCIVESHLYLTLDGGRSWKPENLP